MRFYKKLFPFFDFDDRLFITYANGGPSVGFAWYDEFGGPYDEFGGPYDELGGPYDELGGPYDVFGGPYDEFMFGG